MKRAIFLTLLAGALFSPLLCMAREGGDRVLDRAFDEALANKDTRALETPWMRLLIHLPRVNEDLWVITACFTLALFASPGRDAKRGRPIADWLVYAPIVAVIGIAVLNATSHSGGDYSPQLQMLNLAFGLLAALAVAVLTLFTIWKCNCRRIPDNSTFSNRR